MTALPSLQAIAAALGGVVRRGRTPHVAAPYPGSKKKRDRSLHVFINGDDIGVHVFRDGVDAIEMKDYVRGKCGLPAWQPKPKTKPKPAVPYATRNHFFGETLAVCRFRRKITLNQFALLMNDLRLRGDVRDATKYASEFGLGAADIEHCMGMTPRHYKADERATILNLSYADRRQLDLRRTGSIDVDKAGRERARRDRGNAAKRAKRAAARLDGVNKRYPVEGSLSSNQKEEEITMDRRDILIFIRTQTGVRQPRECELMRAVLERLTRYGCDFPVPGDAQTLKFGWDNGAAIRLAPIDPALNFGALDCGYAISGALEDAGGRLPEALLIIDRGGGIFEEPSGGLASRFCDAVGFDGYSTIKNSKRDVRDKENPRFTTVIVKSKQNDPSYRANIEGLRAAVRGRCYPVFDLSDGQVFLIDSDVPGSITAALTSQRAVRQLSKFAHWVIVDGSGNTRSSDGDEAAIWQQIDADCGL